PPKAPRAAIHQMCQISAKPVTTAKKALTKPVGVFFGTSIGSYLRACVGWPCFARASVFWAQKAARSVTWCRKAKFQAGGGDAVDHSRVRPFQGSPVTSRNSSR